MKAVVSAYTGGYLVLEANEYSRYEDSMQILESLGFSPSQADEFMQKLDHFEVELVPPGKIQCVQQNAERIHKIPKEAIEYNPLASIV